MQTSTTPASWQLITTETGGIELPVRVVSDDLHVLENGLSLVISRYFLLFYCTEKNLMECLVCRLGFPAHEREEFLFLLFSVHLRFMVFDSLDLNCKF